MRHAWLLAAVLAWPVVAAGQGSGVLRISVMLTDGAQTPVPVPRHALLISDNPSTSTPRRVLTGADGTVNVTLPPGNYTVESDRPVAHLGKAYQWTQMVDVVAGRVTTLALTAENTEIVPLTEAAAPPGSAARERDSSLQVSQSRDSVVALWSPTSRASAFLVDARGLFATDRNAVGAVDSVELQLSPTVKARARVMALDSAEHAAIVWVDPSVVGERRPLPLACPPAVAPSIDDRQEIVAIATPLRTGTDLASGAVTALLPRAVETDLRLSFGGAGGPVFNEAGAVIGLSSVRDDPDSRQSDVVVVRVGLVCEALAMARSKMTGTAPPPPAPLPTEPARPFPPDALEAAAPGHGGTADPAIVSSADFDVAFMTPPMLQRAEQRADWTGGRATRPPEAEARIGRLTEFGAWSEYFSSRPSVVIVRVTPKLVEGFWKRLGREAARTQGALLPAFKDFKTHFVRMRASCGGVEVTPIHPFVLEHRLSETEIVREGLYVFDPDAFGPRCGAVTLSLYSEKAPEKPDTFTVDPKVIDRVWQDFAPYREAAQ
jgi:S1-C subfamily serine protease